MNNSDAENHFGEMKVRYEEVLSQFCLIGRLAEGVNLLEDMPNLCLSIVGTLIEFTPAENCSIMLNDPRTGDLKLFVAKGRNDRGSFLGNSKLRTTVFGPGEGAAGWAVEKGQVICLDDCKSDSRFLDMESALKEVNSVICAPIISEGASIGVINCSHSKKGRFNEKDKQNVITVADHAANLLQRALAIERFKKEHRAQENLLNEKTEILADTQKRITELEDQLCRSEEFVTFGELLAGVAHELNNRVAPILIYSQMLQQSAQDEKDGKRLGVIEESALGTKAILETLLNYLCSGTQESAPVNLNQTLQNTLTLIEYKMRNSGIELSTDLCAELPLTMVNEKELAQVFLNITNNALHAMEHTGGKLTIHSTYDRNSVKFIISDSGPGIAEEISEKIFDPFFTTKESARGTGLGLSLSKRYVEDHGGKICIDHGPSTGATFIVEIPRMKVKEDTPPENVQHAERSQAAARILVVDDDSTIRDVIRDVLGPQYAVEFAIDGHDATEKIENDPFDLLVVDYHMPGLDGKQLYGWIADNHPSLKHRMIFSTGDIYHKDTRDFIEGTGCSCLIKPFSTTNLRETVSGVLQS